MDECKQAVRIQNTENIANACTCQTSKNMLTLTG